MQVEGRTQRGKPEKTWNDVLQNDLKMKHLLTADLNQTHWRNASNHLASARMSDSVHIPQSPNHLGGSPYIYLPT